MGGKPKVKKVEPAKPAPLPPVPMRSDTEVQAEAERQKERLYRGSEGRASTMLTGGLGAGLDSSQSRAVQLLGLVGR